MAFLIHSQLTRHLGGTVKPERTSAFVLEKVKGDRGRYFAGGDFRTRYRLTYRIPEIKGEHVVIASFNWTEGEWDVLNVMLTPTVPVILHAAIIADVASIDPFSIKKALPINQR